jgi:hypothetical protein
MYRPRNEQCPKRGHGLTHTVDGGVNCVHCGVLTLVVSPVNVAELREKVIEELKPTTRQRRIWDFLRWSYLRPDPERDNVHPIGPEDREWLEQALAKLDDLDPPEVA